MDLTSKKCIPCEIGTPAMDTETAKKNLEQIPDWMLYGDKIIRQFQFKDFLESMDFVNKIAKLAEEEGHHPDIYIFYNKVKLELSTHAAKGLTENDFIMAAKINKLAI